MTAVRPFAGRAGAPAGMSIVIGTPDSFSDGGEFSDPVRAIAHGRALIEAGADILDIGGESTRPGATELSPEAEAGRVLPVIAGLARAGVPLSIDTRHAAVMAAALDAGAAIVNDVTALTHDPEALALVARRQSPVILMHMQGTPETMQDGPRYDDVVVEVLDFLAARVRACETVGIDRARIAIDPGIGFGKSLAHNLTLLAHLDRFRALGCAVMVGASRKSFIARASGGEAVDNRLGGSLAAALFAANRGVDLVRVHDVAETRQALAVWQAIGKARSSA
ncbi:MAG: dihydropteroate synthase [Alphaproteobacteria bacterium]